MGILDRGIANIIGKLTERIKNRNFLLKMKRNVIDAFLFFFFFFFFFPAQRKDTDTTVFKEPGASIGPNS